MDFEWAGKEGVVTYPLFMNRATETWPEGANDGQLIRKEHDLVWKNKLVNEVQKSSSPAASTAQ